MDSLKKFGLILSAVVFCLSLLVMTATAQPGRARREGNNGKHKGWDKGNHYGWQKKDKWADRRINRGYSSGQLSSGEYRRLQRRGNQLERLENRYRRDGSLSSS